MNILIVMPKIESSKLLGKSNQYFFASSWAIKNDDNGIGMSVSSYMKAFGQVWLIACPELEQEVRKMLHNEQEVILMDSLPE